MEAKSLALKQREGNSPHIALRYKLENLWLLRVSYINVKMFSHYTHYLFDHQLSKWVFIVDIP